MFAALTLVACAGLACKDANSPLDRGGPPADVPPTSNSDDGSGAGLAAKGAERETPPPRQARNALEGETNFAQIWRLSFDGQVEHPRFSSDGKAIAYLHRERTGACATLRVVDLEGRPLPLEQWPKLAQALGDPVVVDSFDFGENWAVSRASTASTATCSQVKGRRLDPAFSVVAKTFENTAETGTTSWQGSPALGAGKLVYSSTQSGDPELWLRDNDQGGQARARQLTHSQGLDVGASFSADGDKIVWTASRPQGVEGLRSWQAFIDNSLVLPLPTEIHLMRADTTGARPLTRFGAHSFAPRVDAQGWLWFTSDLHDAQRRDFDVYRSALANPHTPTRITHGPGFDGQAVIAGDGKAIAFVSDRDGDGLALYYAVLAAP